MISLLDKFQKMNKQKKLDKTRQKIKIQPISGGKLNTKKQNKNISQNNKKFI